MTCLVIARRKHYLANLIHFARNEEASLVNDPMLSKERSSRYVDQREVAVKRKQLKVYVISKNEKSSRSTNSFLLCQTDHGLDRCEEILIKSKLYHWYYMPIFSDHTARSCKPRKVCTICDEWHPNGLNGYKHLRKSKLEEVQQK